MFLLYYFTASILVIYSDALCCYAAKHQFVLKSSLLPALFWPICIPITILAIIKIQQKDTDNETK